jgi:signal transduction histidine kinase
MIQNIDRVHRVVTGLIGQLRPVGFDELGLVAALEHCVNDWRSRVPSTTIEMTVDGDFETADEIREMTVFRLVQEALTNVARHSRATQVQIQIVREAGVREAGVREAGVREAGTQAAPRIDVVIADNGCGADMDAPRTGLGLIGMRERVTALGGALTITSARGAGFKVMASLPLAGSR